MLANTDRNAFAGASLTLSLTCGNRICDLSLKGDGYGKDFTRTRFANALWRCVFLAGYLDGCAGPSQQSRPDCNRAGRPGYEWAPPSLA
jgi:hypothetical protein